VSDIKVGDTVDITFTGVKVTHVDSNFGGVVTVEYPTDLGTFETSVATDSPAVTIEHGVPDIRARDLVVDKDGDLWIAVPDGDGGIELVGGPGKESLAYAADHFAPLRVVWREGDTDAKHGEPT
jgi:hypothetical protein